MLCRNYFVFDGNLASSGYLDRNKINSLLVKIHEPHSNDSINQLLEFYNLVKYLDASGRVDKQSIKKIRSAICARFYVIVANESISDLEDFYQPSFIELVLFTNTLADAFQKKLLDQIYIRNLLKQKAIVDKYPNYIAERIKDNPLNFEYIISKLIKNDDVYIPEADYTDLCILFIKHPHIHPDYLQLIWQGIDGISQFVKGYNEKLRLLANSIYEETITSIINSQGVRQGINFLVTTSRQQFEDEANNAMTGNGRCYPTFVDAEWLHQNKNKESVLNYLMFNENLFTHDVMFRAVNNKRECGLADFFGVRAKDGKEYNGNTIFEYNFRICAMVVQMVDTVLVIDRSNVVNLVEYYFNSYIKNIYGIHFPKYPKIKKNLDIRYKVVALCGLTEHILKCWKAFCNTEDKTIKPEYINLISDILCEKPAGLIDGKNAILTPEDERLAWTLMSDQSEIMRIHHKEHEKCLFELLAKGVQIKCDNKRINAELEPLHQTCILKQEKGNWVLDDAAKVEILARLWRQSCINKEYYSRKALDKMIDDKLVNTYSGLLTNEEFDLLQYVLTNRYRDGLSIRNKYAHGLPIYEEEDRYKNDYYIVLLILIMLVIKIDNELNPFLNRETGKMNYVSFS